MKNILITGGAGFIGSHLTKHFVKKYNNYNIVNLDILSYAGNLDFIDEINSYPNYEFVRGDINDSKLIYNLFEKHQFDSVIHLAAESHVDRSISDPLIFVKTNVLGTANLLINASKHWNNNFENKIFYHVSTDEVYGSIKVEDGKFTESSYYNPKSPYSASKASSDHLVRSWGNTYKFPYIISNCSNNYGINQNTEKLIPLMITKALNSDKLPIYGDGQNVRDWLWVNDHVNAIDLIFHQGKLFNTYNIGGDNEWTNIEIVNLICDLVDKKLSRKQGSSQKLIDFVDDRAGHDRRYAIDFSKLKNELGWKPSINFEKGLEKTIDWYINNQNKILK